MNRSVLLCISHTQSDYRMSLVVCVFRSGPTMRRVSWFWRACCVWTYQRCGPLTPPDWWSVMGRGAHSSGASGWDTLSLALFTKSPANPCTDWHLRIVNRKSCHGYWFSIDWLIDNLSTFTHEVTNEMFVSSRSQIVYIRCPWDSVSLSLSLLGPRATFPWRYATLRSSRSGSWWVEGDDITVRFYQCFLFFHIDFNGPNLNGWPHWNILTFTWSELL